MLYVVRCMLYVVFLLALVIWYSESGVVFMGETDGLDRREMGDGRLGGGVGEDTYEAPAEASFFTFEIVCGTSMVTKRRSTLH